MKIYMAAPLFTAAERLFNKELTTRLEKLIPDATFHLPQEESDKYLPDLKLVAEHCFIGVEDCDIVIACLDGADADSGTCVEVGYARALKKIVIGFRTDFRASEVEGVNIMLKYGVTALVNIPGSFSMENIALMVSDQVNALVSKSYTCSIIPVGHGQYDARLYNRLANFLVGVRANDLIASGSVDSYTDALLFKRYFVRTGHMPGSSSLSLCFEDRVINVE